MQVNETTKHQTHMMNIKASMNIENKKRRE
jgi:hypothetical protein